MAGVRKERQLQLYLLIWSVTVSSTIGVGAQGFQSLVHPECPTEVTGDIFQRIEDISALLHGVVLHPSVCLLNPSVTRLRGDLFLWAARAYTARLSQNGCVEDSTVLLPPITNDGWAGSNSLVLAVTRTVWNPIGRLNHTLVAATQVNVRVEDPRLFKDDDGAVWLLSHVPKGGAMSVSLVGVSCATQASGEVGCSLELRGTRLLWYSRGHKVEKNWVPINGTTLMSYPHFPAFGPHSVLDWGSYREPKIKHDFDSVASNESFFSSVHTSFRGFVTFAGSTPAVLHEDGASYVSVGHVRANSQCFHDPANTSAAVQSSCEAFTARSSHPRAHFFHYTHGTDRKSYSHHYKEYAFFFYRFSASPPYEITHISFGYIPCSYHHSGVTYPAGLERIGPAGDYLISYGEANRYSRLLTLSAANLDRLLRPIEEMRAAAAAYYLCAVPCMAQQ